MLALAALHASRQPSRQWIPLEGRMVEIRNPLYHPAHPERDVTIHCKLDGIAQGFASVADDGDTGVYLAAKRETEMLAASRMYFDRAIDGPRRATASLTPESVEAVYVTSTLVSFSALFTLSEKEGDSMLPSTDPIQWLRLAKGTTFICHQWERMVGPAWLAASGVFFAKADFTDDGESFRNTKCRHFEKLLTWASDSESMSSEDRNAYQKSLSYIEGVYAGMIDGHDAPLATCRRLIALPSRCPPLLVDLVEARRPRAMTILAHSFATMKLSRDNSMWFQGIAEQQIPKIYESLPEEWRQMKAWPMAVAAGDIDHEHSETQIDDILQL